MVVVLEFPFGGAVCVEVVWQWMTLGIVGAGTSGIVGEAKVGAAKEGGPIASGGAPTRLGMLGQGWLAPPAPDDGPTAMQFCQALLPGG